MKESLPESVELYEHDDRIALYFKHEDGVHVSADIIKRLDGTTSSRVAIHTDHDAFFTSSTELTHAQAKDLAVMLEFAFAWVAAKEAT